MKNESSADIFLTECTKMRDRLFSSIAKNIKFKCENYKIRKEGLKLKKNYNEFSEQWQGLKNKRKWRSSQKDK